MLGWIGFPFGPYGSLSIIPWPIRQHFVLQVVSSLQHKVSEARWPKKAWRLIWTCDCTASSITSVLQPATVKSLGGTSSSSAIRKKSLEEHLWSWLNFLSQLKQRPFSRRAAISFGESRLKGIGGCLVGICSKRNEEIDYETRSESGWTNCWDRVDHWMCGESHQISPPEDESELLLEST